MSPNLEYALKYKLLIKAHQDSIFERSKLDLASSLYNSRNDALQVQSQSFD